MENQWVLRQWGHTTRMAELQKGLFAPSHIGTLNGWFTFQAKGVRESTHSQKRYRVMSFDLKTKLVKTQKDKRQ